VKVKVETAAPAHTDYCILNALPLLKLGGPVLRGPSKCRFLHAATRGDIDAPVFLRQLATSTARVVTDTLREQVKAALNSRSGAVSE